MQIRWDHLLSTFNFSSASSSLRPTFAAPLPRNPQDDCPNLRANVRGNRLGRDTRWFTKINSKVPGTEPGTGATFRRAKQTRPTFGRDVGSDAGANSNQNIPINSTLGPDITIHDDHHELFKKRRNCSPEASSESYRSKRTNQDTDRSPHPVLCFFAAKYMHPWERKVTSVFNGKITRDQNAATVQRAWRRMRSWSDRGIVKVEFRLE